MKQATQCFNEKAFVLDSSKNRTKDTAPRGLDKLAGGMLYCYHFSLFKKSNFQQSRLSSF